MSFFFFLMLYSQKQSSMPSPHCKGGTSSPTSCKEEYQVKFFVIIQLFCLFFFLLLECSFCLGSVHQFYFFLCDFQLALPAQQFEIFLGLNVLLPRRAVNISLFNSSTQIFSLKIRQVLLTPSVLPFYCTCVLSDYSHFLSLQCAFLDTQLLFPLWLIWTQV